MQKINVDDIPSTNSPLPYQSYTCVVLNVKQDPSKNTNAPQDAFECQIVNPPTVSYMGEETAAAGRTFSFYVTYSAANLKRAYETLERLGIHPPKEISFPSEEEVEQGIVTTIDEIQSLTRSVEGQVYDIRLKTEPMYKTDNGKWNGKRLKDDKGRDIIVGHRIALPSGDDVVSPFRSEETAVGY